jgi:hypothetical protein
MQAPQAKAFCLYASVLLMTEQANEAEDCSYHGCRRRGRRGDGAAAPTSPMVMTIAAFAFDKAV